eukprot:scaffold141922_cov18-Tisochrysis_lutea.AAC.1
MPGMQAAAPGTLMPEERNSKPSKLSFQCAPCVVKRAEAHPGDVPYVHVAVGHRQKTSEASKMRERRTSAALY